MSRPIRGSPRGGCRARGELRGGDDPAAVEGVARARREREGVERGVGPHAREVHLGRGRGRDRRRRGLREKARVPRRAHGVGRGEALGDLAREGAGEEAREAVAHRGVKALGFEHEGVAGAHRAVIPPPSRSQPREHLVERDGGGVAVGVVVPATARREEGVAVRRRARGHLRGVERAEGEVEEGEAAPLLAPGLAHAEVRGLDVPVLHAALLKGLEREQEVLAPASGVVEGGGAFAGQEVREALARVVEEQGGATSQGERVVERDDRARCGCARGSRPRHGGARRARRRGRP